MKRIVIVSALAGCALVYLGQAAGQERGEWRAASSTAKSITGDVAFLNDKISIDFSVFPIAQIRTLTPAETSAVFDVDAAARGSGNLYRLNIPGAKKFLHKNSLCGSEDALWLVSYVAGGNLQLAFFSGASMPVLTFEAITNSTSLCGTFSYVR